MPIRDSLRRAIRLAAGDPVHEYAHWLSPASSPEDAEAMRPGYEEAAAAYQKWLAKWSSRKPRSQANRELHAHIAGIHESFGPAVAAAELAKRTKSDKERADYEAYASAKEAEETRRREMEAAGLPVDLPPNPPDAVASGEVPRIQVPVRLRPGHGYTHTDPYGNLMGGHVARMWYLPKGARGRLQEALSRTVEPSMPNAETPSPLQDVDVAWLPGGGAVVRKRGGGPVGSFDVPGALPLHRPNPMQQVHVPVGYELAPTAMHGQSYVRKALGHQPGLVTWLVPHPGNPSLFTPHSLPESAFHPLAEAADYQLPEPPRTLSAWVQRNPNPWDMLPFRTEGEAQPAISRAPVNQPAPAPAPPRPARIRRPRTVATPPVQMPVSAATPTFAPSELETRRRQVEEQLRAMPRHEGPEFAQASRQLGHIDDQIGDHQDAAKNFVNALWTAPVAQDAWDWLRNEDKSASPIPTGKEFAKDLANPTPLPADVRRLAARLVQAGHAPEQAADLQARLPDVSRFLETHESMIGVRQAWLAWSALAKLSGGGDMLAMARARDRLLNRLHTEGGESPERDLPKYMQGFTGTSRDAGLHWPAVSGAIDKLVANTQNAPQTQPFIDLIKAWAQAKQGNGIEAKKLMAGAMDRLRTGDPGRDYIRNWLGQAYGQRIENALANAPDRSALSPEAIAGSRVPEALARANTLLPHAPKKILEHSKLINPSGGVNAFWTGVAGWNNRMVEASNETDPDRLGNAIRDVLRQEQNAAILSGAISHAYRGGDRLGTELLQRIPAAMSATGAYNGDAAKSKMLGNGIELAAHYGNPNMVNAVIGTAQQFASEMNPSDAALDESMDNLAKSVHALKRAGFMNQAGAMAETVSRLADRMPATAPANHRIASKIAQATAWGAAGNVSEAARHLDEAGRLIPQMAVSPVIRDNMLIRYLHATASLPPSEAAKRITGILNTVGAVGPGDAVKEMYNIHLLLVAEAAAQALLGGTHRAGDNSNQIADNEYTTRSRIHNDLRLATQTLNKGT